MTQEKKVDILYIQPEKDKNFKIFIPKLRSRGGSSVTLPLMDYVKKEPMAADKQVIKVYEKEAVDLMRTWPKHFKNVVKKEKIKREETEE